MLNVAAAVLVVGQGEEPHKQWIKFLAGTWDVKTPEGQEYETRIESVCDGHALLSQVTFPDGVQSVKVVGWHADSAELVETWYLSSGLQLVNRFHKFGERQIVGKTSLANAQGQTGKGEITWEMVSQDELKTTYRGTVPGQDKAVDLVWTAKRKK